jgi:hypothetical protein
MTALRTKSKQFNQEIKEKSLWHKAYPEAANLFRLVIKSASQAQ